MVFLAIRLFFSEMESMYIDYGVAHVPPFLFKYITKILNYVYKSKNGEPFCPIFAIAVNYFEKYT